MSETILGALIGGAFGFIGVLLGLFLNTWLENEKAKRQQAGEVRLRLVGNLIQTSEVMNLVRSQRGRAWPFFWRKHQPDLSQANLEKVDLR